GHGTRRTNRVPFILPPLIWECTEHTLEVATSSPSAAPEAAASSPEPTAAAEAAASAPRSVTSRTRTPGTIELARPLRAIHPSAAIAIQLCGGIEAQTALCGALTRLPCSAYWPIDIRPATVVVFLPAAALVAVDVSIAPGIDVSRTRSANGRAALRT